jgi:hypothetical protein
MVYFIYQISIIFFFFWFTLLIQLTTQEELCKLNIITLAFVRIYKQFYLSSERRITLQIKRTTWLALGTINRSCLLQILLNLNQIRHHWLTTQTPAFHWVPIPVTSLGEFAFQTRSLILYWRTTWFSYFGWFDTNKRFSICERKGS